MNKKKSVTELNLQHSVFSRNAFSQKALFQSSGTAKELTYSEPS